MVTILAVLSHVAAAAEPTLVIESCINGGPWQTGSAIYPLKGRRVRLRIDEIPGGIVRWYRILPDLSKPYKNANFPWEENAYQWAGLAKIRHARREVSDSRGRWEIELPLAHDVGDASGFHHKEMGSFWFQVEVSRGGQLLRSPGIEDCDEKGLSPNVFRMSVRGCEGYLGYVTSFLNVPGLFGSTVHQSTNYIGVDCADVLMAAHAKWRRKPLTKNHHVAGLVETWPHTTAFDVADGQPGRTIRWGDDIRPGDLIAVRYARARQYQHIGVLYADANQNGVLDARDIVLHAGPLPLHFSRLDVGDFDGHVVILRPPQP